MIYKKPTMRYTDMCIWIDNNVYTEQCDDLKLFEYLYHLVNMLAHQGAYFKTANYYDEFSMMGATRVFLRLKNKKQFEYNEKGEPQLARIKSVLNYIKSIIYPMKVVFEQQTYSQVSAKPKKEIEYSDDSALQLKISEDVDVFKVIDFNVYLKDIPTTCKHYLSKIPYRKGSEEWNNIYLSCLLTFLSSVTLNNKNKERIKDMYKVLQSKPKLLDKLYKKERENCVILYHLDESMRNYIFVLYNRIKHLIANDLSSTAHSFIPSEISARSLIMSSLLDDTQGDDYQNEN